MAQVTIKQIKSTIDRPERQKRTMAALGLKRINHSVTVEATPQIEGMIRAISHLVTVTQ